MIYYPKTMSQQKAFKGLDCVKVGLPTAQQLCKRVLSLPIHPYITENEQDEVVKGIAEFMEKERSISQ